MTTPHHLHTVPSVQPDATGGHETVWLASGLTKTWRICSYERDFGEWDDLADALAFKTLLLTGNPDLDGLDDGNAA